IVFKFALRDVAAGALLVVDLGQIEMVLPGGEVDVVVTASAGGAARILVPGIRLGGARGGFVARGAAAHVGRKRHGRPGGVADGVLAARFDTRQVAAGVDLVDHDLEVGRGTVRVGQLGRMAHDAKFHTAPRAAVEGELVVALVAGRRGNDVARRRLAARGYPGEGRVGVIRAQVELGQVAIAIDSDAMRRGGVEAGRDLGAIGVDVFAFGNLR